MLIMNKSEKIMKYFIICIILILPCFVLAQDGGKAGLIVTPTRVVLEGKQRSKLISIANNGTAKGKYRISVINKTMTKRGLIENAEEPIGSELFANDLIRFSPRSVTLKPGEHQNIRLMVRKNKDMQDGEYRSHMNFMILPDEEISQQDTQEKNKQNKSDNSLTISIKSNFGVSIPVIIRHGNLDATAIIEGISITHKGDNKYVNFSILREGSKSLYGDLLFYFVKEGNSKLIKSVGGIAIYTSIERRNLEIPIDLEAQKGKLLIEYRQKPEDGGELITASEVNIDS